MAVGKSQVKTSKVGEDRQSQLAFESMAVRYPKKDLAYFAGFFDGEGNVDIYLQKNTEAHPYEQYRLRVSATEKRPKVLDDLKKVFGGQVYLLHQSNCSSGMFMPRKLLHFLRQYYPI
jgi:hypothetical protein